jgi:hypothetical protein
MKDISIKHHNSCSQSRIVDNKNFNKRLDEKINFYYFYFLYYIARKGGLVSLSVKYNFQNESESEIKLSKIDCDLL